MKRFLLLPLVSLFFFSCDGGSRTSYTLSQNGKAVFCFDIPSTNDNDVAAITEAGFTSKSGTCAAGVALCADVPLDEYFKETGSSYALNKSFKANIVLYA